MAGRQTGTINNNSTTYCLLMLKINSIVVELDRAYFPNTYFYTGSMVLSKPISDKQVELAKHLFSSLESQVMRAGRKVQAVFGLNAFLVAAISLQSQESLSAIIKGGLNLFIITDLFLKSIFLACVCIATWSAVKALSSGV